ncbi:MAG: 4-hydroxy-tetrahydrodipicolinate reductase [Acidimicrobiia bacterium]|nr:4-hydroxy-tetrahydrodipicolinate reductase [Acidimicrobiia bacterium]
MASVVDPSPVLVGPVRCRAVIRVGVLGAGGRMGATVCQAVLGASGLDLVAAVDPGAPGAAVPGASLTLAPDREALTAAGAEVAVDFTVAEAARPNLTWCAEHGIHTVVGTTGLSPTDLDDLRAVLGRTGTNAVVAPNFAVGAVLMMRFAEIAAPHFETAEVVEMHHDAKADAPSGTAMLTARRMADASREWGPDPTVSVVAEGARGADVDGVHIHSLRVRGAVAHQEVVLGTTGQALTIRHDSYDRSSFMPGVLLAVREVGRRPGLTVGLDALLGI